MLVTLTPSLTPQVSDATFEHLNAKLDIYIASGSSYHRFADKSSIESVAKSATIESRFYPRKFPS